MPIRPHRDTMGAMDMVSTDKVPAEERFAFWREMNAKLDVPYDLRCDPRLESGFRARAGFSAFGPVRATLATVVPHSAHRTPKLIRQADPELFELGCTVRGGGAVTQGGRHTDLGPGDLVLVDTSRPYQVEHAPHVPVNQVMLLHFPRSLLPLPSRELRRLSAVRIPGTQAIGALSAQFLLQLARHMPELSPPDTSRLSTLTLDVLTVVLAHALDAEGGVPPHTRQRALMAQIHAFIRDHLGDPHLNPHAIAAAHHISLRYLHKLFQQEGRTVAGHIRERRLEQCRRDLADPRLAAHPIHAIAARWGFTGHAHFSQAFRGAYGLSPRQFRHQSTTVRAD
ncbi:helix-turn-helix domain-containing protein [Nonomuraea sp. NPDC050643]|uniref:AraC-like ligand-binding domain-containing protein n=1 Tax=Nonomuraea sp. NPDC050643 TaxID=3155660 RepID=UPI0033FA188C